MITALNGCTKLLQSWKCDTKKLTCKLFCITQSFCAQHFSFLTLLYQTAALKNDASSLPAIFVAIFSIHKVTFRGVSSCSCPYLCGPKNKVWIRLLLIWLVSLSACSPNIQQMAMFSQWATGMTKSRSHLPLHHSEDTEAQFWEGAQGYLYI